MTNLLTKLTQSHLERLNIGRRYWEARTDAIPDTARHKAIIKNYCLHIKQNRAEGWGLFLWGDNGHGKTFAACSILRVASLVGFSAYCICADRLRAAYIDRAAFDADQTIAQRVESVDFLLLEDLGTEYAGNGSEWSQLCIENLIRHRNRELLPIIITTNLTPAGFKERYHKSAMSLLLEAMTPLHVNDSDWRKRAAQERASTHAQE